MLATSYVRWRGQKAACFFLRAAIAPEKPNPLLLSVVTSDLPSPKASDVHVCLWLTIGGRSGWSTIFVKQPFLAGGGSSSPPSSSEGGWVPSSLSALGCFLLVSIVEKSRIN